MVNPREIAISILVKTQAGLYANIILNRYLTPNISRKNRALITELVNGVIKNRFRLDHIITHFSKVGLSKISPFTKNAIRLGLYQVFFLKKIPDFAAVNESVTLVKKYEGERAAGFANAILRNALRKKDKITYPNRKIELGRYLSTYYSFPRWLIDRWLKLFGADFTEGLCKAFNERPKLCIRVNTLRIDTMKLKQQLSDEGALVSQGNLAQEALYVLKSPPITQLKSFIEGLFTPQDESSIIASLASGVKRNERVLDVAAAPGGKATHMAAIMQNKGEIIAWDIHSHRIKLIEQNCIRLKTTIVKPKIKNAKTPEKKLYNVFDKVVIDAPCSGLGVIRRKPDIKWSKKLKDIQALKKEQAQILEVCSRYVKPGGILIYSTCSIDPEENANIVSAFIRKNQHFIYDDLRPYLPKKLHKDINKPYGHITLYPNIHGTDGFFIARLKKITN